MALYEQILWLLMLALPVACVAWTVTNEEVFREPREFCIRHSKHGKSLLARKFFYLFTCEYCFSHYVSILFIALTNFKMLLMDWRGYIIAWFALVWIANIYMSLYRLIRVDIKAENIMTELEEKKLKDKDLRK